MNGLWLYLAGQSANQGRTTRSPIATVKMKPTTVSSN
ncbi:hypothetical protein BGS_1193 [Beggiatoa sp. SS]|nr:hypothetical protein BGS_1193 [Beggiatoa sp. SS]